MLRHCSHFSQVTYCSMSFRTCLSSTSASSPLLSKVWMPATQHYSNNTSVKMSRPTCAGTTAAAQVFPSLNVLLTTPQREAMDTLCDEVEDPKGRMISLLTNDGVPKTRLCNTTVSTLSCHSCQDPPVQAQQQQHRCSPPCLSQDNSSSHSSHVTALMSQLARPTCAGTTAAVQVFPSFFIIRQPLNVTALMSQL